MTQPADERSHPPGPGPAWHESWYLGFVSGSGDLAGYVDLVLWPNRGGAWFSAGVSGDGRPLVIVIDQDAPLPKPPGLAMRAEGLWVDLTCEIALAHWSVGLEAFGVALDDPTEALGACRGDRTPLGFDLEWETDGLVQSRPEPNGYQLACRVSGEVLVGDEAIGLDDARGGRHHTWGEHTRWADPQRWVASLLEPGPYGE